MKIVIAPDSYKESLSALDVSKAIAEGLREVWPDAECICVPMADGGEGTVAAVLAGAGGEMRCAKVTGPTGEQVEARFALTKDGGTAVLEMASASGLELVPDDQRDPMKTTSFGTGELIAAALDAGVRRIVMGLGGSATVDGGAGMLQALGAKLLDNGGKDIARGGEGLEALARIDLSGLDERLQGCTIEVAGDVDNPLTGEHGAAEVFGPQKGASPEMVKRLDAGLARLADVMRRDAGADVAGMPGSGAAGGMAAALVGCLGAKLRTGVELVAELVGLDDKVRDADLVITGEGRIDGQSVRGKTPVGVAKVAKRHGKPVIALAGSVGEGAEAVYGCGIDAVFGIMPGPAAKEKAFAESAANLRRTARNIAAVWKLAQSK